MYIHFSTLTTLVLQHITEWQHRAQFTIWEIRSVDTQQLQRNLHQWVIHQEPRPERVQDGDQVGIQSRLLGRERGKAALSLNNENMNENQSQNIFTNTGDKIRIHFALTGEQNLMGRFSILQPGLRDHEPHSLRKSLQHRGDQDMQLR